MTLKSADILPLSAADLAAKIRSRELSAVAVLEFYLDRYDRFNDSINAVIFADPDAARAQAAAVDVALGAGRAVGPLAGIPMTIKDAFEVTGMTCEVGVKAYHGRKSEHDAYVVERLKAAGAIIYGKTNTPYLCSDWQSFNDLHGTTNNPWNLAHTPGGSSGGSAAALASGMTALEYGSDIGGSIRVPAHFCGLFGHKPSYGIIPTRGHVPPPHGSRSYSDLSVVGPLGRHVSDIDLLFDLTVGLERPRSAAFHVQLQGPRAQTVKDLRFAVWANDAACPVATDIEQAIEQAANSLVTAGATRLEVKPPFNLEEHHEVYSFLLNAVMAAQTSKDGANGAPHAEWIRMNEQRARYLDKWMDLFTKVDVVLCPVTARAAVPHTQDRDFFARRMQVNGHDRAYNDLLLWPGVPTNCGLPATSVPLGLDQDGLPIGMQIIAPPYEDKTSLAVAAMLENLGYRSVMPSAYLD